MYICYSYIYIYISGTPSIIHAALNLCHYPVYQIDILCNCNNATKEFMFIRLHLFGPSSSIK